MVLSLVMMMVFLVRLYLYASLTSTELGLVLGSTPESFSYELMMRAKNHTRPTPKDFLFG